MHEHAVVVVGGGPTGLMLAAELALAGTDVVVIERRADHSLDRARAGGLHPRTLEVLDQRGIADRFIAEGTKYPSIGYAYIRLDVTDLPTRHNYLLGLAQSRFEPILADWAAELGVRIVRNCEVIGFAQDDAGVTVTLSNGDTVRAQYLVGCDGGRSLVRKMAGIEFPGVDPSVSFIMGHADATTTPTLGIRPEGGGIGPLDPASGTGGYGFVVRERTVDHTGEPTFDDLRSELVATYGTDFGVHSPTQISRFTDMARQADRYRLGRVLLAGDAAHVHAPLGGQGLNTGVQDAVNLGWKLAHVVSGRSPDHLLDTYHAERHPVGARVLDNTLAQSALIVADERHRALHATITALLALDEPRHQVAAAITALDVHYDGHGSDDEHPLVGRRMPDLDLHTATGTVRLFELLHDARPILVHLSPPTPGSTFDDVAGVGVGVSVASDHVRRVDATYDGDWQLPVIGHVTPVAAALIRPDGHVVWTGTHDDPTLPNALTHWFGT